MSRWREHWQYLCFRLEHRIVLAWPFRALAWLLSRRVPLDKGFGKFADVEPFTAEQLVLIRKHAPRGFDTNMSNIAYGDKFFDELELTVPESEDFGEFGDAERNSEDARILQELLDTADDLSTYGLMSTTDMARVRALCDEAENARLPAVLNLRAITPRAPLPLSAADKADRYRSGRFAEMTEEQAGLSASQAYTAKQRFDDILKKFGDKQNVMHLRADHPILDPKNDHLFTADAAHKAFEHIKGSEVGAREIEPPTPEQHAVLAKAEPMERGKVVDSVLPDDALHRAAEFEKMNGQESSEYFLDKCGAESGDFDDIDRTDEHGKCISHNGSVFPLASKFGDKKLGSARRLAALGGSVQELEAVPRRRGEPNADAAELTPVKAQLADAVDILKAREAKREERVANFVIWGLVLGMLVAFVAAVAAIVFMK